MNDKIPIVVGRSRDYDVGRIKEFCDQAAPHLGLPESMHGTAVLLKPNLISSRASKLRLNGCGFFHTSAHTAAWKPS